MPFLLQQYLAQCLQPERNYTDYCIETQTQFLLNGALQNLFTSIFTTNNLIKLSLSIKTPKLSPVNNDYKLLHVTTKPCPEFSHVQVIDPVRKFRKIIRFGEIKFSGQFLSTFINFKLQLWVGDLLCLREHFIASLMKQCLCLYTIQVVPSYNVKKDMWQYASDS